MSKGKRRPVSRDAAPGYFRATEGPWPSLVLIVPLIVAYEAATRGLLGVSQAGPAEQLVAFSLLQRGFDYLGATGSLLPAFTLVGCLLGWHIARRDRWRVSPAHLAAMPVEGALLALPIVGLALAMERWLPCAAMDGGSLERMATLASGAAIYEELLFRLIAFTVLHLFLVDVARLTRRTGDVITLIATSILFAAYHYLGAEGFTWPSFVFRTVAGMFLGSVFLTRGIGVTIACHWAYDMIWIAFFWRITPV